MENKIQVFKVGTEGGGASVFRTLLGPGSWQFHVEGSSMTEDTGRLLDDLSISENAIKQAREFARTADEKIIVGNPSARNADSRDFSERVRQFSVFIK